MSLSLPAAGSVALWIAVAAGAATAMRMLAGSQRQQRDRRHLAALGWSPQRLSSLNVAVTGCVVAIAAFGGIRLGNTEFSSSAASLPPALLAAVIVPPLVPGVVASVVLAGQRRRLDAAVLLWLRRIRLFVAAGRPISAAVLDAAERVSDPAFAPAAGAINAAVIGGQDPLAAVADQLGDSPTAALLGTVDAAERSGAAASELLDRVLDRVVRSVDDRRRGAIDRLGRGVGASASMLAVLASAVVMVTVVMTLPSL
ncbi:type II secretion system F family protein [Candidatus Poriferisodalis sp.]|uniref:type II secretion system F family protein n=1 Tax=Candidatus Poriferisodalis sp. TaxID=3101277 RepID=UPI003B028E8B